MTYEDIIEVVNLCKFPKYTFNVLIEGRGEIYLQASYYEPDTITHKIEKQLTRRWFISPSMTDSEITQTCFKCIITSAEHRIREWFTYRNEPVYSPHFDVEALYNICIDKKFTHR